MDIKKIIRTVLKEELDASTIRNPMMNSEDVYYEAGNRCATARRKRDESSAARLSDWFNRALALEAGENKQKAQDAFNNGYRDGSGQQVFSYLKETGEWNEGDENLIASTEGGVRILKSGHRSSHGG